jgi:2,3-bisphosphoglycerate-independent phosphoglycerate mutase
VLYQDLVKISKSFSDNTIIHNTVLNDAIAYAKTHHKPIHLMGLMSDGGVHAHIQHTIDMLHHLQTHGVEHVYVHAWTDGRDTDPRSGLLHIENLLAACNNTGAQLASIVGRYYAMDRDTRRERVQCAYDLLVDGQGEPTNDPLALMRARYEAGETDEFLQPIVCLDAADDPIAVIEDGDVVICMNYRSDRAREITRVLTQESVSDEETDVSMEPLDIEYLCMTPYDESFTGVQILFPKDPLTETLGEVLEAAGKTQMRVAETEKYPHVTFFFSGGREQEYKGEQRLLCPSPKVATYDLQPEMSAPDIASRVCAHLETDQPDFIVINFANADMVGHTGVFSAVVQAVEAVDHALHQVVEAACTHGYEIIIIADHGNADIMRNPDGSPHTQHTLNPVPCILVTEQEGVVLHEGSLVDIAPTVLDRMGVEKPLSMTGRSLVG